MSDLLSRLESRIRQAVEKIEEYQLEIAELKAQNSVLEEERQEMHDKLQTGPRKRLPTYMIKT